MVYCSLVTVLKLQFPNPAARLLRAADNVVGSYSIHTGFRLISIPLSQSGYMTPIPGTVHGTWWGVPGHQVLVS